MSFGKRSHYAIDLTSDDDGDSFQKRPEHKKARGSQPLSSQSLVPPDADQWNIGSTQAEGNEENDIIDLSQQEADEGFGWTCVGAIDAKIVGIRYYNGTESHVFVFSPLKSTTFPLTSSLCS